MYSGNENLYKQLGQTNLVPNMNAGGMFGTGRYVDIEDGKLHRIPGVEPEIDWLFTNPNPKLYCMIYKEIWQGFGFIPRDCLTCYKVVVVPRSFHELMCLLDLQEELIKDNPNCWCKCGVESRHYVPRHYGGYFYTQGLDQGKVRWKTVREAVSDKISPEVSVILKRYCTEYELKHGDSDKYKRPPYADGIEKELYRNIDMEAKQPVRQPEFIRKNIIHQWMVFAHGRGDPTVALYNNNEPLFAPPVTYHKEV